MIRSVTRLGIRWRRIGGLTPSERRLLAEAWVLSVVVATGLRVLRFNRLLALLERLRTVGRVTATTDVTPHRAAKLVEAAASRTPATTCLTNALVLHEILWRRGVETEVLIGAKPAGAAIEAHAWLRHRNEALLGGDGTGYVPLWQHGFARKPSL